MRYFQATTIFRQHSLIEPFRKLKVRRNNVTLWLYIIDKARILDNDDEEVEEIRENSQESASELADKV